MYKTSYTPGFVYSDCWQQRVKVRSQGKRDRQSVPLKPPTAPSSAPLPDWRNELLCPGWNSGLSLQNRLSAPHFIFQTDVSTLLQSYKHHLISECPLNANQ